MNVLLLDNYDSFTYNLYQIIVECGVKNVEVVRNDKIKMQETLNSLIRWFFPRPAFRRRPACCSLL